ncbi:STM3941 family protein [Bradyrhizobium sp. Bra78]|uniref:STM3941 family protein n=1 Tax=Bradyrhizobium sp. Bra78 TaxID=2926010 RepID=UPI0021C610AA|nr:STM3941 family protein [Bradyrhizobium sp. Bra78]
MSVSQNLPNLAIGYSLAWLLGLLGASLLLTLLCAALAFNWHDAKNITAFQIAICYFGVALFGLATCKMLRTLISSREPVVFVTRVGIRDIRIADDTISWRSVRDMSMWRYRSQKIVVLQLDPLLADRFAGSFLRRVLSLMNKPIGADGVLVNAGGLTMDGEALFETCRKYWTAGRLAYSGRSATEPEPVH